MADKKPGPVKPPIIDAKPRPAEKPAAEKPATTARPAATPAPEAPKPATQTASAATKPAAPQAAKPDSPAPKPEPAAPPQPNAAASKDNTLPVLPLGAAAGAGALIGLALAYGLASFGLWPQQGDSETLATIQSRTDSLETALAAQQSDATEIATRLDTVAGQLAGIEAREPASTEGLAAQADFDTLAGQIAGLSTRIDAVAAGASSQEASEVTTTLADISTELDSLIQRLDTIEPRIGQFESFASRLDDLDARIADQADFDAVSAERDRVAQLPAAIGALETAIATGNPFATQLATLETLLPALTVSADARAAASGVTPPADLLAQFRADIPKILSARPQDNNAGWAETLLGQAASTLALRPTDGDSPEGLVGRTEAALASGDLDTAATAFAALPPPMQAAAPGFAETLAQTRAAQTLLHAVRAADPAAASAEAGQ